ncbi:MAG: LemA family protein [Planctomycetota bacterium]
MPPLARVRGSTKVVLLVLLAVVALLALVGIGQYNGLVGAQEQVKGAWSQIDNQYKRRADLIPNLVETVKGAADFEKSTLQAVTEARAAVAKVQLPAELPTDPDKLAAYLQAQQQLGGALSRLFAVAENYPQLRATESFKSLQDQLEGTENRVAVARKDYIDAARTFNTKVRSFPANLFASMFGFAPVAQFEAEAADRTPPKVEFGQRK